MKDGALTMDSEGFKGFGKRQSELPQRGQM